MMFFANFQIFLVVNLCFRLTHPLLHTNSQYRRITRRALAHGSQNEEVLVPIIALDIGSTCVKCAAYHGDSPLRPISGKSTVLFSELFT